MLHVFMWSIFYVMTIQGERLLLGHFLFSNIRLIPLDSSQSLLAMLSL